MRAGTCQRRPQDDQKQREHDSGKTKTYVNTVSARPNNTILFLGKTFAGPVQDYTMFKQAFPPPPDWLASLQVLVDLGEQGILKDYTGELIRWPPKKPRQSNTQPLS